MPEMNDNADEKVIGLGRSTPVARVQTFARILISGILLVCAGRTKAQLLVESPVFPQDTSTVTITLDATLGNQGLLNFSDPNHVYVYTGVITSASTSASDWLHLPFSTWSTDTTTAARATYLGNNKYQYTIHNIRSFYSVPAGETIQKIAILFRSADGNTVQRNTDGSDMFLAVFGTALAGQFTAPPFQPLYTPAPQPLTPTLGSTLPVTFVTNQAANLQLFYNGLSVATATAATSVQATLSLATAGNQQIIATAGSIADTIDFFIAGANKIAPFPTGVKEGINYLPGDTSVVLAFYAPLKHKVVVVGDFNNWTKDTAYQMTETPDSNYYWIQINGLTAGTEYAYQYVIDDSLQLADYNTEKVLDKSVDPTIPATTYPNLKTFPAGAAGTLASVIQTGQTPYTWQVVNFQRPDKKGLMIYELWLADFTTAGNWQALIDTLGYLKHLGVNAIEVEPICNFEGANSWGYNPNFYFAPDKVYGTATDVKRFVDACHAQGMAVIMDLVMNHSFGSSPMVQMYWENSLSVPAANSPWFNQYPTHGDNVGYQFNHESPATVAFTKRVVDYWLTNYHIDGYRWDLAKGFTQTRTCDATGNNCDINAWGNYDSSRVRTWDTIYNQMQASSAGSYCILEMFAATNEQVDETNAGMLVWQNMNSNYNQATMGYSNPSWDLSGGIWSAAGYSQPGLVVYQESHDEERLQYKNEQYGNASGAYNIKDTATGLQRNAAATAFWAMTPGPKMLTEFGELGFDYSINWCTNGTVDASGSCRLTPKPIRWDYLSDTSRKKLHDVYAAMLALRGKYTDLATATCTYSLGNAFKTLQLSAPDLGVTVIGNFDVVASTGSVTFPTQATWYEYFTGSTLQATGSAQSITLQPGEFRVYLSQNLSLTTPVTSVSNRDDSLQIKVVPNPASIDARVEFSIPDAGTTTLSVFSMTGQQLGMLQLGYLSPHTQQVTLVSITGNRVLAPGVYWVRLGVGEKYNVYPFVKQ
jgi:hypothetical protein